jgi:hypothetical protein
MSTSKIKAYESVDVWVTRIMEFAVEKPSIQTKICGKSRQSRRDVQ